MNTECRHVRELMDSYLSEELSVETNHAVLRHVAECPACGEELRRRQRLRALLAQALDVDVDVERARRRIGAAVDREQRSWSRVVRWSGVAATVIAAVAATYWFSRPVDASAYVDSAADHVQCALGYPASVTYDPARAAQHLRPPFQRIAEAIGLRHGDYHVIDAHMCPFKGRDYAHQAREAVSKGAEDARGYSGATTGSSYSSGSSGTFGGSTGTGTTGSSTFGGNSGTTGGGTDFGRS